MRLLAIIFPLLLLVLVYFAGLGSQRPDVSAVSAVTPAEPSAPGHLPFRWVGHDWVEEVAEQKGQGKRQDRRETFGFDATGVDAAECLDPNCRACLIDLVYGQEF